MSVHVHAKEVLDAILCCNIVFRFSMNRLQLSMCLSFCSVNKKKNETGEIGQISFLRGKEWKLELQVQTWLR